MLALHAAEKTLRGVRSKYADQEEKDNGHENPEFDQAGPEGPRDLRGLAATLPVLPGDAVRSCMHERFYFYNARIYGQTI